jgi:SAM-dependent methyltransferase
MQDRPSSAALETPRAGRSPLPLPDSAASSRRPLRPDDFPDWATYYWTYQYELASTQLHPCLEDWGVWRAGVRILDVGCGDGGGTCALAEAGARIAALDIDPRLLAMADERARSRGLEIEFDTADITSAASLSNFDGPYDLILFRDVLEHIPDVDAALAQCSSRLADGGGIVVIYPPYWSPYGGHQQTLSAARRFGLRWAKLPFIHWLPMPAWAALARSAAVPDVQWEDVSIVRRASLTIAGLGDRARRHGLRVDRARRYFLRPSVHLRYGVPVLDAGILGRIPLVREVMVSGSWELLTRIPR